MNVMLLAAGEGTRLRPHTLTLPKPAIPFLNVPLAAYSLALLEGVAIENLVVNTFHLPEKIVSLFEKLPHRAEKLFFSKEERQILGNGGGLKHAEAYFRLGGDFVMMNSDEVILPHDENFLKKAVEAHRQSGAIATLCVMDYLGVGTKFGGVWTDDEKILGFGKDAVPGARKAWHFIGVQILSPKIFGYLTANEPSNILYDGVAKALQNGHHAQIFPVSCEWFETGNEKDFLSATAVCLKHYENRDDTGKYLEKVFSHFQPKNRLQKHADGNVLLAPGASVAADARIEGACTIGRDSVVESGSVLRNTVVGEGLRLPAGAHFHDQICLKV